MKTFCEDEIVKERFRAIFNEANDDEPAETEKLMGISFYCLLKLIYNYIV